MTAYAAEAAGALADIKAAGAAVTFSRRVPGTYDESTGLTSSSTLTSVAGYAMRVRGNPKTLDRLSLKESEAPTLLFAPSTSGSVPLPNDSVSWGGVTYIARDVDEVSPDGTAIIAKVVVAR